MSSQQLQTSGAGEWNIIKGQLRDNKSSLVFNFEVRIKDGVAMTWAEDKTFVKKMVKYERGKGNENIVYAGKGLAMEKFPGINKDEITKDIILKLKSSGANITKT